MASLILALGFLIAAREMHVLLLTSVFRWPMELFDVTPTGRVLNRFSKDVDVIDNVLPQVIKSWIFMFFAVNQFYIKQTKKKKQMKFNSLLFLF